MLTSLGRLLFSAYILVLTAIFLMTGDKILGLLIIVTIGVHLGGIYALRHPDSPFTWLVFRRKFGPNTDTRCMTKRELLQSGVRFLVLSLYPFLTLVGLGAFGEQLEPVLTEKLAMAIYFACSIFFMACMIGGIYLLIRGVIRSSDYEPKVPDLE